MNKHRQSTLATQIRSSTEFISIESLGNKVFDNPVTLGHNKSPRSAQFDRVCQCTEE